MLEVKQVTLRVLDTTSVHDMLNANPAFVA